MAFPQTPLDTLVELRLGGSCVVSGAVGALTLEASAGGGVYAPYRAVFNAGGDLDVRLDVAALDWTPPIQEVLASQSRSFGITTPDLGWYLYLEPDGRLQLTWSADGTYGAALSAISTAAVGASNGTRKAVRAVLDIDDGSGNRVIRFYTAATVTDSWTQLGATVTFGGTTGVADVAADLEIGSTNDGEPGFGSVANLTGKIYGFQLRRGVGAGTRIAAVDFTSASPGEREVVDYDGNLWVVEGSSQIAQDWVDVTSLTYGRSPVGISRGRADETSRSSPSSCTLELDNRTGDFSQRNPAGAYYGRLNGNTPLRVSLPAAVPVLEAPYSVDDYVFCRDTAGISVAGDLDIRVDLELDSWQARSAVLAAKWADGDKSYVFILEYSGHLWFGWSPDGSAEVFVRSTTPVPAPHRGRKALRMLLTADNGIGGSDTSFYTSDSGTVSGPWTQFGDTVVSSLATIYDGLAELRLLGYSWVYTAAQARFYAAQVRGGTGATTVVASPDFTAAAPGARSLTDAQGNVWYLAGLAEIHARDRRFTGEVSSWPPRRDTSGVDASVVAEAAGISRRLGQGVAALASTLRRGLTSLAGTVVAGYWPCEDGDDALTVSSALPGTEPLSFTGTAKPDFASFSGFRCSSPIPQLKGSTWTGPVPFYMNRKEFQVWFLMAVPEAGVASEAPIVRVWSPAGDALLWQLHATPTGDLRLLAFDAALATLVDSGAMGFGVNGKLLRVSIGLQQSGADVTYLLHTLEVGKSLGTYIAGSLASAALGVITRIDVNHEGTHTDTAVGHISAHRQIIPLFSLYNELNAYLWEPAGMRIARLCGENSVPCVVVGSALDTTALGYQMPRKLSELLEEAAEADGGILYEPRGWLGLAYRTRVSMYAQAASVSLDYGAAHLSGFEVTPDDRGVRNDVTVARVDGGRARRELTSGRMSTRQPPEGRGRYDEEVQLSLATDGQCAGQASWRLGVGTAEDPRCPSVGVNLARAPFAASAPLTAAVRAVDVGDMVAVGNPPADAGPDTVRQLVQGVREVLSNFEYSVTWNGAPASPWDVGVYDATTSRYSSGGSRLAAAVASGATSLSVRTLSGPLWGHGDGDFDIVAGGERMTVTAVSGASSPQAFTVTRAVNGVVKAHAEDAEVELFAPVVYGL